MVKTNAEAYRTAQCVEGETTIRTDPCAGSKRTPVSTAPCQLRSSGTVHGYRSKAGAGSRATLHLDWALRDHAWFVAFAPYDDPRYALSVLVEHGGWGASAAAPRAREIMRVALLKDPEIRARIEKPLPMPAIEPVNPDPGGVSDAPPLVDPSAPDPGQAVTPT